MELFVEPNEKKCSRCKEFKSAREFYKQGNRLESSCKSCKQKIRGQKKNSSNTPKDTFEIENVSLVAHEAKQEQKEPKSYEDYGLTKEDFLEIVEYFRELLKLDQIGG